MNNILITICSLLILSGCASTSIVKSWKDPDATPQNVDLNKVLVGVLSSNETARRTAEDQIAGKSPIFVPSYQVINKDLANNQDQIKKSLQEQGFDGIFLLQLLDKVKSETYVPGNYSGGYWGRYGGYWRAYYNPGYYQENNNYIIEISLYSLEQENLLWSGISSTVNPSSLEKVIDKLLNDSYNQLVSDGLIITNNKEILP